MRRIIKKIIRIILVLMIIVSLMTACTYKAYAASAAGVVVAGGSIGTGGAAAGLLGLMGPVTAILGVALASYGIYVVLDESAEAEGKTKTDFLYEKVTEYNEQRNLSDQAMQDLILQGASVLKNGAISISNAASTYLNGFINYLFSSDEIVTPDQIAGGETVLFGGFDLPILERGVSYFIGDRHPNFEILEDSSNIEYVGFRFGNTIYIACNKQNFIPVLYTNLQYNPLNLTSPSGSEIWYAGGFSDTNSPFPDVSTSFSSRDAFLRSGTGKIDFDSTSASPAVSSLVGDQSIFNANAGTLSPSADENTVFTPPLVGSLPGTGSINITDYLDAIIDLLNDGATDIPIADPVTDVVSSVAVTDVDLTDTIPGVDSVEEQENIGATIVVDPDLPVKPDTNTINSLAFDLREIFPFCIPFDLYDLLSKFVAEPEAPHWEISIPLPMNLPALEFEIDLSGFESVGVVLRSFEMVLFVASLAVATRSIYLRG